MGEAVLYLNTSSKPKVPEFSRVVRVETRYRDSDNTWNLVLALEDATHIDPFMSVCKEIIEESAKGWNPEDSLDRFYSALSKWKSLFRQRRAEILGDDEQRGLAGEMWVATEVLAQTHSMREVLDAWVGPFGAPQDFQFVDGLAVEVKATRIGAKLVHISSLQQLEPDEFDSLRLIVLAVETSTLDAPATWTLPMLASRFRETLGGDEVALGQLERRLDELKFDDADPRYEETFFRFSGLKEYEVSEGFPRIAKAAAPLGVDHVKYELSIKSMQEFEIS